MTFMRRCGLASAGAVLALGLATPAAAAPPLPAYGRLPAIDSVELSPDGRFYAAIVGDEAGSQIQVRALADGKLVSVSAVDKAKARELFWAGPDHVLAMLSTTQAPPAGFVGSRTEFTQVQDLNLVTRSSRLLMDGVKDTLNIVAGAPMPLAGSNPPAVIVPGLPFVFGQGSYRMVPVAGLYRVDLASAKTTLIETGTAMTERYLVDAAGRAFARADYDEAKSMWSLHIRQPDAGWRKAYAEAADLDHPELLGPAADGSSLLVARHTDAGWGVYPIALATGTWGAVLPGVDPDGVRLDPSSRRLLATVSADMATYRYDFADPADQRLWTSVTKAFPGEVVTLQSWSDDRMAIIVHVEGPANGDGYFLVDRRTRQARPLGSRYPGLGLADIGERRIIRYQAGDGMEIAAYLTLPPGRAARQLPLIVLPHGGPVARDSPGFDWWSQALASRGYAVLQPQFRGSKGLGTALQEAAYGEFGRRMLTDLSDGVAKLAADGIVDPKRVCIAGASYGGYAALAGVALQDGVYRCASSLAGLSDLRLYLGGTGASRSWASRSEGLRFWLRLTGARNSGDLMLDTLSPARLAARIKVPVQLIHGKDDTVVRFAQSSAMEKALRAAGGSVELVTLEGEDHWLSRATTRIQMLTAMVAFLEKHNPPGVVTAAR